MPISNFSNLRSNFKSLFDFLEVTENTLYDGKKIKVREALKELLHSAQTDIILTGSLAVSIHTGIVSNTGTVEYIRREHEKEFNRTNSFGVDLIQIDSLKKYKTDDFFGTKSFKFLILSVESLLEDLLFREGGDLEYDSSHETSLHILVKYSLPNIEHFTNHLPSSLSHKYLLSIEKVQKDENSKTKHSFSRGRGVRLPIWAR